MLNKEALKIMQWAKINVASITAEHVKEVANMQADWLSRQWIQEAEWSHRKELFRLIVNCLRQPVMDIFALAHNHHLERFL